MKTRYWMCSVALVFAACTEAPTNEPDMTTTTPDMPTQADMPVETDMGPTVDMNTDDMAQTDMAQMCAMECFANSECPATQRCENSSGGASVTGCCVDGERGTKTAGEPCADEFECDEGLCIARNDGPELCSKPCMMNEDCPAAVPECNPVLGVCVEADM